YAKLHSKECSRKQDCSKLVCSELEVLIAEASAQVVLDKLFPTEPKFSTIGSKYIDKAYKGARSEQTLKSFEKPKDAAQLKAILNAYHHVWTADRDLVAKLKSFSEVMVQVVQAQSECLSEVSVNFEKIQTTITFFSSADRLLHHCLSLFTHKSIV